MIHVLFFITKLNIYKIPIEFNNIMCYNLFRKDFKENIMKSEKRLVKVTTVQQSYALRRMPTEKKIPPHVRYNPDTINPKTKEEEIELN